MLSGNVLVTGGAGYIGSHACKALAEAGATPVSLDNLVHGHSDAVRWGPFVKGDLADGLLLRRTLREHRIEAVLHFAAYAYVGESMGEPGKYFINNFAGSLTLLEAMRAEGVGSIVFSSTCATYGVPRHLPIDESSPQLPVNPYGESKLFVERALARFEAAHGLRYSALRYFNAAGADAEGQLGEDHDPETHLIPLVIEAAQAKRPHVSVFGTDYPTRDGTAIRDYVHVTDLADAHVLALRKLQSGADSFGANLGTGRGHTVREVIAMVEAIGGRRVPVRNEPRRPGDPPELVAGGSRAREILGWIPQHSSLRNIVQTAWRWHARRSTGALAAD